jgi:hypothetical protein
MRVAQLVCLLATVLWGAEIARAAEDTPTLPVGLDAYRQWERWGYQRIGERAYMRSTYDRRGGNESADASHFLYQVADDFNVTLDTVGPGVLYFVRTNHWHGSPWHYEVDGVDHVIRETGTADPENAKKTLKHTTFIPEHLFPNPLVWTWSTTKGADLNWVPMPFERSFRLAYSRTRYGTGYYIYHLFDPTAPLSQPIRSWDGETAPDKDVLDLLARAGNDLAPTPDSPEGKRLGIVEKSGEVKGQSGRVTLADIDAAPSMIRALEFEVPRDQAIAFGRARLRVTWDNRQHPSIDAPMALFFGAGTLYNRDSREYLVKGFPMFIRYPKDEQKVHLACFYPMPFFRSARLDIEGLDPAITSVRWRVRYQPFKDPARHVGYFHATYRDHPEPKRGHDLVALDTRGVEGNGPWAGSFVGMSWIFSHRAFLGTLEGDPRFFFDDSQTPQAYGTGTEEWGGGGDYWGGENMTLPLAGHPVGAKNAKEAKCDEDMIESAYRFLLADLMPFGRRAVIRLEHGGENQTTEHYETVVYWYGAPHATLVPTDMLKIGDAASEKAHGYHSSEASEPYEITSRYEWGVDTVSAGEAKQSDSPVAQPTDFADFEFDAPAGEYFIWIRGKNLNGLVTSDAVWLQFDEMIGTKRLGATYSDRRGFGNWLDEYPVNTFAWSSALPDEKPQTVRFDRSGQHRLRLQPRHPGHVVEQIWLSQTRETLPKPAFKPVAKRGEIVLSATNAKVNGKIEILDDSNSQTGKVFRVGSSANAGIVVYPPHTDVGRKTKGTSEFSMKLRPDNFGVVLRRKLDYAFPNQRAEVYVADERDGKPGEFHRAGTWYLAGSNTCVYSDAKGELGETLHNVQTSNRRFRDDEFIVPRELTRGRERIRVRVKFIPMETPLFPGHPLPELAWSEIRYTAYSWVLPDWKP